MSRWPNQFGAGEVNVIPQVRIPLKTFFYKLYFHFITRTDLSKLNFHPITRTDSGRSDIPYDFKRGQTGGRRK